MTDTTFAAIEFGRKAEAIALQVGLPDSQVDSFHDALMNAYMQGRKDGFEKATTYTMTPEDLNHLEVQPDPTLSESAKREFNRGAEAMRAAMRATLHSTARPGAPEAPEEPSL